MESIVYNRDCMMDLPKFPDKYFDLAVVDPPYGIERLKNPHGRLEKYGDTTQANNDVPKKDYFDELMRVSKRQIIWGGNYFDLPPCRCFLTWYKHQPVDNYSDVEMAWTNMNLPARTFDYPYFGGIGADEDGRYHPTQKPIALYRWIFSKYAKRGDKILDTHLGSGSSRIAAYDAELNFVGYEIDKEYFDKQEERFESHSAQLDLFLTESE